MKPIVITLLLGLATPAAAGIAPAEPTPAYRIDVPAELTALPEQARTIAATLARNNQFGGLATISDAAAYADRKRGVSLVVSSLLARERSDHLGQLIAAELATAEDAWRTATLTPGDTESLAWKLELSPTVADARLDYRHHSNETITYVRTLLYVDAQQHLGSVTAECTMLESALDQAGPICRQALASLELTAAPLAQLPELPAPPPPPATEPEARDAGSLAPTAKLREPSSDHPGVLLARKPPPPDHSYRWLYLIGGILLVVAFYLTTRSRRTELDRPSRQRDGDHDGDHEEAEAEPATDAELEDQDQDQDQDQDEDEEKKS